VLGVWGLAQWFGHISLGGAGDVGVRAGVRLTSAGVGQLQGGEYAYPVVVACCVAALASGTVRGAFERAVLWAALGTCSLACLVTFERTFWLSALTGIAFVVARGTRTQRIRLLAGAPVAAGIALAVLSIAAPGELTTARERLLSLGQHATDDSVRYRIVESGFVLEQVHAHPVTGSGLAATIFWGQPWAQVPARSYAFSHNGYLWLAWKLGVPAAALLVLLIAAAVALRGPPGEDARAAAIRRGAQGALLGLLLATITFPSFSALGITPAIGVLLALAVVPAQRAGLYKR
jgi:hypothetical protein